MGVCRPTSSASWLCFIVFLNLMFQIHIAKANSSITAASSTTTTTPPPTTTTEKVTSKAPTTTTSQGTTVTSSSSVKTTAPSVPTTTTAPPGPTTTEAPALGVDCSNKGDNWCNSAISGAVECRDDRCQCRTGHFQSNSTSCTSLMDLIPQSISTSGFTTTSFNVAWVHEDSVKDLVLDHTVTARLVYNEGDVPDVTCNVASSFTASCSKLLPGCKYEVTITASFNSSELAHNVINESTVPNMPGALNATSSDFNALNVFLEWNGSQGCKDFYSVEVTGLDDAVLVRNESTSDDSPSINIGSLEKGKTYNVSITANSYGKSSPESTDTFTVSKDPGPPTNVNVASVTADSIKITWTKTEKPNGVIQEHQVCVKYKFYIEDSYDNQVCQNVSADITEYEKSSLTAGTFYQFDVYTVNNGFKSNNASVYQRTVESVPTMVSGLEAESHDTSLNVTWSRPLQPNGDIVTYRVHWRNKTGHENCTVFLTSPESNNMTNSCENITELENISVNQENLNYMIINLIPYTMYTIEVTAYTTEGPGEVDTIDKMTSVAAPDPVTNVIATVLNDTAVNVTWKIPTVNPGPVNYTVTTNNMVDNTFSSQSCEVEGYDRSGCVVSGLEEYWLYNFNVTASTDEGTSNPSVSQNITTNESEPGAVSSFSYKLYNGTSDCDATKARVRWEEPGLHDRNSLITRYKLQSEQSDDKYPNVIEPDPYRKDNRSFEKDLPGLKADSKYTWKISALSGGGEGPLSSLSFTTGVCAPPVWKNADIQEVKEKSSTTTSLTIMLPSSFFDKSQQGRIEEKGLIILPRESDYFDSDTSNIKVETLLHWQNAKDHQFIKDYKIMITDSVAGEFTIGEETRCVKPDFCNGPLPEQFSFKVAAYACTRRSGLLLCTVSPPLGPFATEAPPEPPGSSQSAVIIVLSVLLVLSACAAAFVILWYKEIINPITWCPKKGGGGSNGDDDDDFTALDRIDRTRPIKIWEYATVLEEMHKDTNLILSDQYDDINRIGQLVLESSSTEASRLESNTPKNRWVNILPWI